MDIGAMDAGATDAVAVASGGDSDAADEGDMNAADAGDRCALDADFSVEDADDKEEDIDV
eukprot:10975468-Ditylum_brightwellii.AAC.1